jgi:hypothetical protein
MAWTFRDPILFIQLRHRERNRQIKARSLFPYCGWSDVDGDLLTGPPVRAVAECAWNPTPALFDRGIG